MTNVFRQEPVVTNQSVVLFSSAAGVDSISFSNTVETSVVGPVLRLTKSADKVRASLDETLVYTIEAANSGNTPARLTLYDALPQGLAFIPNSILRDGMLFPGTDPALGIPLGTLFPGSQVNLSFHAVVVALSPALSLQNQAVCKYSFVTPEGRTIYDEVNSNTVTVSLLSHQMSVLLTASTPTTFAGDTLSYTLVIRNEGIPTFQNIIATVTIPAGTHLIAGSVVVSGVHYPESDPSQGIQIGTLASGTALEVTFQVRISRSAASTTLTNNATVTYTADGGFYAAENNSVSVEIIQPEIEVLKQASLARAVPGESFNYAFTVTNHGNMAVNAVLMDVLPPGTLLEWDSVRIEDRQLKGANPAEGIALGVLLAHSEVNVDFRVTVPITTNVKEISGIRNQGNVQYTFLLPDGRMVRELSRSNLTETSLHMPMITAEMTMVPNVAEAEEYVQIEIDIVNHGNWPATVALIRLIPEGTQLDPDSFIIDGQPCPQHPYTGTLPLGTLNPGTKQTIVYFVQIQSSAIGRVIKGFCTALYLFEVDGRRYSGEVPSNPYRLTIEEISE